DPAVAHPDHIAGGKMHQSAVIGRTQEIQQVFGGFDVRRKSLAQIRIKVGQTGAVHDQVDRTLKPSANFRIEAQSGQAHIASSHSSWRKTAQRSDASVYRTPSSAGDSPTHFTKRRRGVVGRLRRISGVIFAMTGTPPSRSSRLTLPRNPVTPTS